MAKKKQPSKLVSIGQIKKPTIPNVGVTNP